MRFFSNLSLAGKIVLLVALLGALAAFITLYSLSNLNRVDKEYRFLITHHGKSNHLVSDALLDLSDSSRMVLSVLTEQEEQKMHATLIQLESKAVEFREKVAQIRALLPHKADQLERIAQSQAQLLTLSRQIIHAAARWRGDRAMQIIHQSYEPALNALRNDIEDLRHQVGSDYTQASEELRQTTQHTLITTATAFSLALLLSIGLATYVSIAQISRPINRLTHVMRRLAQNNYQDMIHGTRRRDEVGQMAEALQVFRDTMLRAELLEREAAASAEIRRLSQQLLDLADAIPGAVFQLKVYPDQSRQLLFTSSKLEQMVGRVPDTQQRLEAGAPLFPDRADYHDSSRAALETALQTLQPLDFNTFLPAQKRWLKTLATVQRETDGNVLFNCILLDITEMQLQAQLLKESKELAEQAARAKSSFLATMSHEIRTPMNAILGLAQASLRHQLPDQQRTRLERILHTGRHLLRIINDILEFSRSESGQLQIEAVEFSPARLLDEALEMLSENAEAKGLRIHRHIAPELPDALQGDMLRIGQILINYLNNAIKFSTHGDIHVRLSLETDAHQALFLRGEVQDQGIGISPAECERLFAPFRQADASISRRFGGTGLGLSISRNLATLMQGDVGVSSVEGLGSTFWFRARVQPARTPGTPVKAFSTGPAAIPEELRGLHVLLVDDNELNRLVGAELLESAGVAVDLACDGEQALCLLEKMPAGTYDAVLMDIMMPVLDGLSATRRLRLNPAFDRLPVIALSANSSPEDIQACREAGMQDHLGKPVEESQLWQILLSNVHRTQHPEMPTATPPPAAPEACGYQPQMLEQMRQSMAPERFDRLLGMLLDDCRQRQQRIRQLNNDGMFDRLQQEAHDLISTAGHAGLTHLAALGQALRKALKQNDATQIRQLSVQIDQASAEAIEWLQQHFRTSAE